MKMVQHEKREVIIVTGAFRGIGYMLARHLMSSRVVWPVCRTYEQQRRLEHATQHIGSGAFWFHGDLRKPSTVKKITEKLADENAVPYACILCPGPIVYTRTAVPGWKTWRDQFQDNVSASVHMIRALSGLMRNGRIILFGFSGIGTAKGFRSIAAYAAAKESIAVLGRAAAKKLASKGITVNIIAPGIFRDQNGCIPAHGKKLLRSIPLSRFGNDPDICGVVDWLLSPDSDYVTGQTIKVSGGLHISGIMT